MSHVFLIGRDNILSLNWCIRLGRRIDLNRSVINCLWLSGLICILIILTVLATGISIGVGIRILVILILVLILIVVVWLSVWICWVCRSGRLGIGISVGGVLLPVCWVHDSTWVISSSVWQNLRIEIKSHANDC